MSRNAAAMVATAEEEVSVEDTAVEAATAAVEAATAAAMTDVAVVDTVPETDLQNIYTIHFHCFYFFRKLTSIFAGRNSNG